LELKLNHLQEIKRLEAELKIIKERYLLSKGWVICNYFVYKEDNSGIKHTMTLNEAIRVQQLFDEIQDDQLPK
jgi:hypothetical protein